METKIKVEVCAGSVEDCVYAEKAGADRIELNNALHLGGLTPSLATLIQSKEYTQIPIIAMVRPRGGGFHYNDYEKATMREDAKILIENGADGIVFGFLNADKSIDADTTQEFVGICHSYKVEAVFHRAFDQTSDPFQAVEDLISCGVDRILTSGLKPSADQGVALLEELQKRYGNQIEFCVGAGVNKDNARKIVTETNISQLHSSFKGWYADPTTEGGEVSYRYSDAGDYEGVSLHKLSEFMEMMKCLD
nr:copper homeostasis protein CutC [uncultured Trichococcus sp.]